MYILAMWGDDMEVAWTYGSNPHEHYDTLFGAMERYLLKGEITEILDVVHADPHICPERRRREEIWKRHITNRDEEDPPCT